MRYLCLIYSERAKLDALPVEQLEAIKQEYFAYIDEITRSGHHQASEGLQPVRFAKTVRVRNGRVSTTDGPFAETKEQLGGFFLITAKDLNEAIQLSARIPGARWGSIEIRPIREL